MKRRTKLGLMLVSVISATALVAFLLLRPVNHPDFEAPSHARVRNAASIAAALSKYQFDHNGRLPDRLSELVPQYVEPVNIRFFFAPKPDNGGRTDLSTSTNVPGK